MGCSLRILRDELTPTATSVPCPVCKAGSSGSHAPPCAVASAAFLELAAWSRSSGGEGALRPISDGELKRFQDIEARAAAEELKRNWKKFGSSLRLCPSCGFGISKPRGHHCHQ